MTAKPVHEFRFAADFFGTDFTKFREALVAFAGGFTELGATGGTRYIVGLGGRGARERLLRFLASWAGRTRAGRIALEKPETAADRDEIYFLLPLKRNPPPGGGPRAPLLTNEDLALLREKLAMRFHFRPEMVQVYGEWRSDAGELVPDHSLLIRVPRRGPGTVRDLRRFVREEILKLPGCDQEYIYLSAGWRGEFVARP